VTALSLPIFFKLFSDRKIVDGYEWRYTRPISADPIDSPATRRLCVTLYVILGIITLSPLLWVRVPPLVDYPNHLARMWILVHSGEIPELASNYIVHWRILPDLAIDLVVSMLSWVLPVEQAGRVFTALTMLMLVGGTVTLHRVLHGRLEVWPICSVLFVYNAELFWGFVNCLFATGVYLFAFSGWIATQHWRAAPRILTFSAIASLLLLLHLFAFGLYCLSVASHEMGRRTDQRGLPLRSLVGWGAVCLQFVPGVVLWYASLAQGGSTTTLYGYLVFKFYAVVSPFTFGFSPVPFDFFTGAAISLFLLFAVVSRSLKLVPEMRLPLAAMILVAMLMPNRMSGSWLADIRLPVTLPFVIIASTRFGAARKGLVVLLTATALIVLGLRVWTVSQAWRNYDSWFAEFRTASAVIPPGARLLIVEAPVPEQKQRLSGVPPIFAKVQWVTFIHMAALTVIDRAAFVPYMFTGWTTIDVTPRNVPVSQRVAVPMTPEELAQSADPEQAKALNTGPNFLGEQPYWRDWPETFDFVLWVDFSGAPKPKVKQLQLLKSGSFFDIYAVLRP
jgi:hypothetical protein